MAITFKVGFQVDDKNLKAGLAGIQQDIQNAFKVNSGMSNEIVKATQQAMILEKALKRATSDKGVSYYSLTAELNKAGTSASKLVSTLAMGGDKFAASLNAANVALATADRSVISLNSKIKEMSRVVTQSFKFTAAQTFLQGVSNAAREAYQWVEDLNKTITDISVVTGYQGDKLDQVTQNAISGARELRIAANEYAEGALIFYQQGLGDDEVARRTEITAKAAAAAGSSLQDMSSQLTAIWNTYKMVGDEQQRAASVGAKMAADTAVDFSDIAEAMQTAAAPAEQMGVSYNSLAAIIATVGDTTQQSASVIGNAFKTIFSRFQQLKSEGTDGEVTLNRVSSQLQELGVNVLDSAGELRQLDSVIAEVGNQWEGWSSKQQLAIAQLVGGTRQYGQFLTLMNNFDKYQDLLMSANAEDGSALEQQYASSLESIESKAKNAGEAWNRAFGELIDEDAVKVAFEAIEGLGDAAGAFLQTIGGVPGILSIIGMRFSREIIPAIQKSAQNAKQFVANLTPEGRIQGINRDYANMEADLDKKSKVSGITAEEKQSLEVQRTKNEIGRQTAIVNEKINTLLKTANEEQKISLNYWKQQANSAQELYNTTLDQIKALKDQAAVQQKIFESQSASANPAARLKTLQDQDDQNTLDIAMTEGRVEEYRKQYNAAKKDPATDEAKLLDLKRQLVKEENKLNVLRDQGKKITQEIVQLSAKSKQPDLTKLTKDIYNLNSAYAKVNTTTGKEQKKALAEVNAIMKEIKKEVGSLPANPAWDQLKAKMAEITSSKNIDTLRTKINTLATEFNGVVNNADDLPPELKEALDYLNKINESALEASQYMGRLKTSAGSVGADVDTPNPETPTVAATPKFDYTTIATGFGEIASASAMAAMSISNFFQILEDDSATAGEKFLSFLTMTGMLIPTIKSLNSGVVLLGKGLKLVAAEQTGVNAATVASAAASRIAALGFKGMWKALLGPVGLAIAAIGAVTAGIAALVWWINEGSPEAKLEAANESLEEFKGTLSEVEAETEQLTSYFDEYDSLVDKLKACTTGTDEWREAIRAVNEQVIELLTLFPSLSEYITRDENGVLGIDQEGIEKQIEYQNNLALAAQAATYQKDKEQNQAAINVTKSDMKDSVQTFGMNYQHGASIYYGGLDSLSSAYDSGTFRNIIEDFMNEYTEEIASAVSGEEISSLLKEYIKNNLQGETYFIESGEEENYKEESETMPGQYVYKQGNYIYDENIDYVAGEMFNEFNGIASDYTKAIERAEIEANSFNEAVASMVLAGEDYSEAALDAAGNLYGQALEEAEQQVSENFPTKEDLLKEFGERTGKDTTGLTWEDGKVKIGDVQYTEEQLKYIITALDAMDLLTVKMAESSPIIDSFSNSLNGADQAVGDFLGDGFLEKSTTEDIAALKTAINGLSEEDIKSGKIKLGDMEIDQAMVQRFGYETIQEFVDSLETAIGYAETDFSNITEDLTRNIEKAYERVTKDKSLSTTGAKSIASLIQKSFDARGLSGQGQMEDFLSSISSDDLDEAAKVLGKIDWNNITPEGLLNSLEDAGVTFDKTKFAVEDLALIFPDLIAMLKTTESTIEEMASRYSSLNTIADEVKETGILTSDQVTTLKEAGLEVDSYVTMLRDGTYIIKGSAMEFYEYVKQAAGVEFNNEMVKLEAQRNNQYRVQQHQNNYEGDYFDYLSGSAKEGNVINGNLIQEQMDFIEAAGIEVDQALYSAIEAGFADQESYDKIAELIRGNYDKYEDLAEIAEETEAKISEMKQSEILSDAKMAGLDPNDIKTTAAQLKELAEDGVGGLTEELADNDVELVEIAKDLHLFGKGAESVIENYEDWAKAIKNVDKAKAKGEIISPEDLEMVQAMHEALANMIGLDMDQLPDSFVMNAESLELMKQAAEGSGTAMQQLEEKIRNAQIQDLQVRLNYEGLQTDIATVQSFLDSQEWKDLDIGVGINYEDQAELYNALNRIIADCQAAGIDANAALANLGFDAELVPVESEQVENNEVVGYTYEPVETEIAGGMSFSGRGSGFVGSLLGGALGSFNIEQTGSVYGVKAVPEVETEPTTKEMKATALKIKPGTLSKAVGGNVKVGNGVKVKPSGSGNSSPKSGGGGGSSPKFARKSATKTQARGDRYEDINKKLEQVDRGLGKLSDSVDDAFGIAKLRNLQKINAELQKQAGLLNQLRDEAKRYMPIDKKALENAYDEIWTLNENLPKLELKPFEYNEDGFVSNWEEVSQPIWDNYIKAEEKYYNLVNSYNDKGVGNEAAEEEINAAKEYAEQWKSIYEYMSAAKDQVNDTAQEMADALEKALENIREWMSNKLEEAAWKMELQVAISENDISLMDYFIDKWGDLGIQTGKTWDWLNKSNQANMDMITATEAHAERMLEILNNIDPQNPNAGWFSDEAQFGDAWNEYINGNYGKPEEIIEALQDDFDSMLGYIDSMYSNAEEMLSQYIDTLDLYMDKFDRIANKISANNDRLQMFQELLEFSGKQYTQAGRQAMKDLADASVSNAATEVYRAQAALDVAKKGAEDAQGQLEDFLRDAGDDPTQYSTSEAFVYNKLKEAADSAQEVLESAQGDMTSAIQDLASAAAEAIEQVAQVIKQEVVENLGGDFADFGSMTEMYDQQYDLDHFFLEDYDKNYQLNKLLGQIDDQMADITDPSRLEEYKALIDEINAANAEGVEITQTDIDLLNAKFELQKAQDAYEEAQNAKNTMRLARDASGNWSYVYSTDTEQTEDAAQKLADAQYNYDKLLHEARDESSQLWIQAQQEFFEFQESIDQARYASDEKYRNQIDQQMAYYQEKTRLYSDQVIKYNDMLGDNFEDTSLGIITNYDSMESAQSVYTEQHKIYHEQLEENTAKYGDMVKDVCKDVGFDYDNLEKTISEEAKLIKEENNQLKNNIDSLRQEAIKDLDAINQKVGPWRVEFCRQMELAEAAVMKVYNALQKLNNMSLDQANTGFNANRDYTATGYNALIAAGIDPTDEKAIRNFFENTEEGRLIAAEWANKVNSDEMAEAGHAWAQGGDYWNGPVDQEDFINAMINAGYDSNTRYDEGDTSDASNKVGNMGSVLEDLLKQILNNGLSTGGLVKKPSVHSIAENGAELVLNPVDTQNILDAVAHMREVVKMRINNASASLDRKAVETTSKAPIQETTQMVDQQVHIDATFPNVSVAAEIEEAFNNLINQAVQYSSQKK